jgi:hypothetical protein
MVDAAAPAAAAPALVAAVPVSFINNVRMLSWSLLWYISNRSVSYFKFAMLKSLMICFVFRVHFNVGELGRFVLDQYEIAMTPQNLMIVNTALNSVS